MKKVNFLMLVLILATFIFSSSIVAQTSAKTDDPVEKSLCCKEKSYFNIPDLTDEQKKKIDDFKITHLKEVNLTKAQLNEKYAHLRTLQLAEKPDNKEINKTIDEISNLKAEMMKKHETYRQNVRALLNEKQRVIFDSKACSGHGKGCCSDGKSKNCGGNCKHKGHSCNTKDKAKSCTSNNSDHQPVKGKGCCHRK